MPSTRRAQEEKIEQKPTPEDGSSLAADDTGAEDDAATQLPPLAEGDIAESLKKLDTDQHFTQPPPRFSEASLVKALEDNGIGRPSRPTRAIIATIEAREYTEKREAKIHGPPSSGSW